MSADHDTGSAECGDDPCAEALAELYHYLSGELTEEIRTTVTIHLELCSSCLSAFDFEAEVRRVVALRCRDRVPDELRARIARALEG